MKATYINDPAKAAGNGIFIVSDLSPLDSLDGVSFGLKRASDGMNLGHNAWQDAETFQAPLAVEQTDSGLKLFIGPNVVDNLDMQETYRFFLHVEGKGPAACTMHVEGVAYSPMAGGQGVASSPIAPAPKPTPPAPKPVEQAPPPPPVEEVKPETMSMGTPQTDEAKKSGSKLPLLVLLGLVVVGAAAGGLFMMSKDEQATPTVTPVAKAPEETPMTATRKHLSGPADPAASLELAAKFRSVSNGADAAFLLIEDAAQKGNAKGMLLLAGFYDPLDTEPVGSIAKDPKQAWEWYQKAKNAGEAAAEQKLNALKAWAEAEAAKGSAEAKELLKL